MPSKWVKVLPWYYTERKGPKLRQQEEREAIEFDLDAEGLKHRSPLEGPSQRANQGHPCSTVLRNADYPTEVNAREATHED